MNIVLCKDVEKLGRVGDVVKVKDGFARNFLVPQKAGYPATPENLKRIAQEQSRKQALETRKQKEAELLAEKLNKLSCTVSVEVNDLDKPYGSVTEADIVRALEAEGFSVDKKTIILEKRIEELGIYEAGVRLHPSVTAKIRLWVTKK